MRIRTWTKGLVGCLALLGVMAAVAAIADAQSSAPAPLPKVPPDLEKIRVALQKYEDPIAAVRDGYFSTLGCVEIPKAGGPGTVPYGVGGMGIHFLNTTLLGPEVDPNRPQILLYEPVDGKLRLVGAEWFVPLATGVKTRPVLFGAQFDGPMEGHHPLLPLNLHHYDLHVWLWKENPTGLFKPINPSVKCGDYSYTVKLDAPKIVHH